MSIRIKNYIVKYKYEVIGVIFLPVIFYFTHLLLLFFHQFGLYIGVFLRNLYEIVV